MCVQALLSFQIDFLDVLTGASVTAQIAACGMYMCILPQLTRKSNLRVNPKQNRFTTMLVQSQGWPTMKCQVT